MLFIWCSSCLNLRPDRIILIMLRYVKPRNRLRVYFVFTNKQWQCWLASITTDYNIPSISAKCQGKTHTSHGSMHALVMITAWTKVQAQSLHIIWMSHQHSFTLSAWMPIKKKDWCYLKRQLTLSIQLSLSHTCWLSSLSSASASKPA